MTRSQIHQAAIDFQNTLADAPFKAGDSIMVLPAYQTGGSYRADSVTGISRVVRVCGDSVELPCGSHVSKGRCLPLNRPL